MTNFITIEDVNSAFINAFDTSSIYECDTANIDEDDEYTNTVYDFLKITHTISGSNHTFSFSVGNVAWTGDYYFLDEDGEYIDSDATYSSNVLSITTTSTNVTLGLYISYLKKTLNSFNINRLNYIPLDTQPMLVNDPPTDNLYRFKSLTGDDELVIDTNCMDSESFYEDGIYNFWCIGYFEIGGSELLLFGLDINDPEFYYNILKEKPSINFLIDAYEHGTGVVPGKMNTIKFESPLSITTDITFTYNGQELEYGSAGKTYSVRLDLTDVRSLDPVTINVNLKESGAYLGMDKDFVFNCRRREVWDFNRLKVEAASNTPFIELRNDITFTSDLILSKSVNIEGKNKAFNLNGHSIILGEDGNLNMKNIQLDNGDKAIIQNKNSKLILENVTFENNTTSNVGSCIYCNVDMTNVNENDDYTTVIKDCTFTNNNSCISHNGILNITGVNYKNDDLDYANKKFPAFLYQNNGEAGIRNSIFDIDYDSDDYCSAEKNIGFAQALIHCGETAFINGADMFQLKEDGKLPFFNAPYNNRSHLLCKYYYPKVETCAYSSPELGYEDKSICYSISEDNWIYKQNVKVTRADSNEENTIRSL